MLFNHHFVCRISFIFPNKLLFKERVAAFFEENFFNRLDRLLITVFTGIFCVHRLVISKSFLFICFIFSRFDPIPDVILGFFCGLLPELLADIR